MCCAACPLLNRPARLTIHEWFMHASARSLQQELCCQFAGRDAQGGPTCLLCLLAHFSRSVLTTVTVAAHFLRSSGGQPAPNSLQRHDQVAWIRAQEDSG